MRILFVSNGNGEAAIVARLAKELHEVQAGINCQHLALVGRPSETLYVETVGPQQQLPSGGLIAMGNVRNIMRDIRAGLLTLTLAQFRFLRLQYGIQDVVVAIGDSYALMMALQTKRPVIYVGTAKSVYVAAYGPGERILLRRAKAIFVRDSATAINLRAKGVMAEAPGNVIADLYDPDDANPPLVGMPRILLLPGSRQDAYFRARELVELVVRIAPRYRELGALLSLAPGLPLQPFLEILTDAGFTLREEHSDEQIPFRIVAKNGCQITAWRGPLGAAIGGATMIFGQAGTANEAAAAAGVPIVAYESNPNEHRWYRMRQRGLLGDAVAIVDGNFDEAAAQVQALLDDPARLLHMSSVGRERMGSRGASRIIAERIVETVTS